MQRAIERARVYDKCSAAAEPARLACQMDKALVNVGALFLERVAGSGRVSTEVDPRLAYSTGGPPMVARTQAHPTQTVLASLLVATCARRVHESLETCASSSTNVVD